MKERITRIEAVYTIAGSAIGAGILALPVSMAYTGFLPGAILIIIAGLISIITALYIVETVLRTGPDFYMPGLAEYYFGKTGLCVMFASILIFVYGALVGYLSAGGQLIHQLSNGYISYSLGTFLYFAFSSSVVYVGLKLIGIFETILFSIMVVLIFVLAGMAFPYANPELVLHDDWGNTFNIVGVVLFAYASHAVIPSVTHGLKDDKRGMVISTIWGFGGPMILYLLWVLIFCLVIPMGAPTETVAYDQTATLYQAQHHGQPATIPLGHIIGGTVVALGSIFALFATFTSYLGFGVCLTDSWMDFAHGFKIKLARFVALLLTVVIPLIIALTNPGLFIQGIEIAGTFGAGIFMGIMPALMVIKARKKGKYETNFKVPGKTVLAVIMFLMFVITMIYEIIVMFA